MIVRYLFDVEQCVGLALALLFLILHRPRRWGSLQSLTITGWPLCMAIIFGHGLLDTFLDDRWSVPVPMNQDVVVAIVEINLVLALLLVMAFAFYRFRYQERHGRGHNEWHISPIDPAHEDD
jgi:hypothetical protein